MNWPPVAMGLAFVFAVAAMFLIIHVESGVHVSGVALTPAEQHGAHVFSDHCAVCHTLAAVNAVGEVGPNLDMLTPDGIPAAYVAETVTDGQDRGRGNMPSGIVGGADIDDVAEFVCTVTTAEHQTPGAPRPAYCDPAGPIPQNPLR
jgi:mono/diheme cytochrome c family protein